LRIRRVGQFSLFGRLLCFEATRRTAGGAKLVGGIDQRWHGVRRYDSIANVTDKAALAQICALMSDRNAIKRVSDCATSAWTNCDIEVAIRVVWESTTTDGDVGRSGNVTK
jgi:hypothetical protein